MSAALWFGQPVDVLEYSVDPDVGQVGRVRTADGSTRLVPVHDLEGAEDVPDIATCGTCGRSWNFTAYRWPASLCPFCVGDPDEAAPHEVFPPALTDEPGRVTKLTGANSVHNPGPALTVEGFEARMDEDAHAGWCRDHITETDSDDGHDVEVCRRHVTFGPFTVDIEDSPEWPDEERRQIVPPDLPGTWVTPDDACQLAGALIEAARLIEDDEGGQS